MEKLGAVLSVMQGLSRELAQASVLVPKSKLGEVVSGDKLYFYWPYVSTSGPEPVYLRTELTGDLIDRILVYARASLPTIRRAQDRPDGVHTVACTVSGDAFVAYPLDPESQDDVFFAGIGRPTRAKGLPGHGGGNSVSLYVQSQPDSTRLASVEGVKPPIGSGNPEFVRWAQIGQTDPSRPFRCLDPIAMKSMFDFRASLNNAEAATFVFGLMYLKQFWLEIPGS